jgi:FemAB-related protein (PEP-CTERM system-associated)
VSLPARVRATGTFRIAADPSAASWDAYVSRHPDASAYHLHAWRDVIAKAFGHESCYLAAEGEDGLAGILPLVVFRNMMFGRFLVSMPFLNYGGVLADSPAVAEALLDAAVAESRRRDARFLELRHVRRHFASLQPKEHKVGMRLALQGSEDAQWTALDRKLRNQVRKADKSGVVVARGGAELLPSFYDVFSRNMRDLGTPVYTRRFFDEVLATFPGHARVFVATLDGRAVAGSITCRWRNAMEVPWASSLREYNPLCANVRLYWEMLRAAVAAGCTVFDFGRSTPHEATYQFKKQWGAEPLPLVWEYWTANDTPLPDMSPGNARFRTAIAVWKRLPVGLTRVIGPPIVRNIP